MSRFDLTMTYKQNADVFISYIPKGFLEPPFLPVQEKQHDKLICSFISSRFDRSGRKHYLKELCKYVDVHRYGRHGNRKILNDDGRSSKLRLVGSYKFTFEFENSIAEDYVYVRHPESRVLNSPGEPIDVVYTWVDGSCEAFHARLAEASNESETAMIDSRARRFRQNDELRFSLRSLERNAKWLGNIYLVTNGQKPAWLNADSKRLHLIRHDQIFPDQSCLPTFNSNAIEMNLHRIPGLSRKFLYLNDDLFFGRNCERRDFTDGGRDVTYFERIDLLADMDKTQPGDRACMHTLKLLEETDGLPPLKWMPAHVPQIYDREIIAEIEAAYPAEFKSTSAHRFRSAEDFVLRIACAAHGVARGRKGLLLAYGRLSYSFLQIESGILARLRDFVTIFCNQPKFFCINDDLDAGVSVSDGLLLWMARMFLRLYFPGSSDFER